MGESKNQIISEIETYLVTHNVTRWNEVYVGISKDPEDRLFNGHRVQENKDVWIYCQAFSSDDAREVEKILLAKGADGGPGGGDDDSIYVYAYKKAMHTVDF